MGNCVSSVIDFFHSSFHPSTFTNRQHQMERDDSSTSTALERQMEVRDYSTSAARHIEVEDRSPFSSIEFQQRQMEVGESSTSRAREDKRESENPFDGITPQASSSSPAVMKKGPWDVFINHRGCDTKRKLASTIYHTLDLLGLHAFLDMKELELGDSIPEEIQEAMRTTGLHIAIFSERYAESPWCLAELSFMLKTGTPILPVFYNVKPDDLRWVGKGKGIYAPAFSQHKEMGRYSSSMQEDWKRALESVSNLSGHVFNGDSGDEGMLLKSIVNSVLRVTKKEPLEVAKHPVGMDAIVEDFERSRREYMENEQQVQIVGIVGFGGSGKTTLATELYNRKSSSFHRSSFVRDVRDAASRNALHAKQKKLLEDLRIQAYQFDDVSEGKIFLEKSLKYLQVLIVLDDVDQEDQLDSLLPSKESLGSGSLVIVTTREGEVLTKWGITSTYKMQPLQHLHAKQLFCWHAFLRSSPQEGYEDLVKKYLDVCNGLPLSLKVIGGQLYGKRSKDYWNSQLDKIKRILPKEILQRLKVSYDALDEEEKEIFLDVACFLIGERLSSAIAVWDGSGWSGLCSWETLLNKCLVEVGKEYGEEYIRMHDHLRDLGRNIAETHSPSRICFGEEQSMHIQRGMPIRGIDVFLKEYMDLFLKEYMEMMRVSNVGLQILTVQNNEFTEECQELSRGILWLRWSHFEHKCIPSWLSLKNIRVLELLNAKELETLWEDAQAPLQLRELLLHDPLKLQSFPRSIGYLKHLKRLSLVGSILRPHHLSSLPEEFCRLHSLEHLELEGFDKLLSLPNNFGNLVSLRFLILRQSHSLSSLPSRLPRCLQHIDLHECTRLEMLPESFKQLTSLEYLDLTACFSLVLEEDILDNITSLRVFIFPACFKLQVLPRNITNQASLRELNFVMTHSLREIPDSIDQLSKLEEIEIKDCPLLTRLPTSLGNLSSLETLSLRDCLKLYEIPSFAGLVSLKFLRIIDCPEIKKIEGLEHLRSLETLLVSTDLMQPGLHSLAGMERLRVVKLKADNISAFEACIQSMQIEKWPLATTTCGRNFPGVQSILDSFTFPGLDLVDSFAHPTSRWSLTCEVINLSNAAMVCFLVRSLGDALMLIDEELFYSPISLRSEEMIHHSLKLSKGEWIVISVFKEIPPLINDGGHSLQTRIKWGGLGSELEALGGWLIVGERGSVLEGFKQLFQTLCKSTSMS